jgi:hypothetical protein
VAEGERVTADMLPVISKLDKYPFLWHRLFKEVEYLSADVRINL